MSGTPVLSALTEGLAGTVPVALRGWCSMPPPTSSCPRWLTARPYEDALAEAQRAGVAERDPAADVEGYDATAKVMILSALVFGGQLGREQVVCLGFSEPDGMGTVTARVQSEIVQAGDLLASTEGAANAVVCQAAPVGEVPIIGPGAGPQLAGQGVPSDIIAVARRPAMNS